MIFAVPIALLAAIYTSQFMEPNFRQIIKPTIEIMASLPSVVLAVSSLPFISRPWSRSGFRLSCSRPQACRWPHLLLGWLWSTLPITMRKHIKPGYETLAFIPVVIALIAIFWSFGPVFERFAFVTTDRSGQKIADFRYWWPAVTGASFEQRNSPRRRLHDGLRRYSDYFHDCG